MTLAELWRAKTDGQLFAAARRIDEYTEEGQRIIQAEVQRRSTPEYRAEVEEAERRFEREQRAASGSNGARLRRRVWLLALVLAVPAMGFGCATGVQATLSSNLREQARTLFPDITGARVAQITVQALCKTANPDLAEVCATNRTMNAIRAASLAAVVIGFGLTSFIGLAGMLAGHNRSLLLVVFKSGLSLTAILLTVLVLVDAAILMASIYFGESAVSGQVHGGLVLAVGLGAAYGVAAILGNVFGVAKKAQIAVPGRTVTHAEAPALWAVVERAAAHLDALRPDHVVIGLDCNFFVTESNVMTFGDTLGGRTLYCSLPLARILTTGEFLAIVGHELGHFRGEDTKYSERFYPIYRGTAASIASLQVAGRRGFRAAAVLPAIAVFSYFLESFSAAERRLGRDRELAADQAGASVTDARVMATALVKVHAYGGAWAELQKTAVAALTNGKPLVNVGEAFADIVARRAASNPFEGIAETQLSHPTDSHPALSTRLESLSVSLESVESAALVVAPSGAAASLLPDLKQWEQELSGTYQSLMAQQLRIKIPAAQEHPRGAPSAKPNPIRRCNRCGINVLPAANKLCPRCGGAVWDHPEE
jgi:Zn-dependent protease with chaperone function